MKTFKTIISTFGIVSLLSCQHQEEIVETSNDINKNEYYDLFEEAMSTVFNNTYENVTIKTSFGDMANMFEENSKKFFEKKGLIVTSDELKIINQVVGGIYGVNVLLLF